MSNSKADIQIMKIAKILHGPSCGTTNCADCHYHDIPSIFPVNDRCHDYYSAIELVKQGFVDGADFVQFLNDAGNITDGNPKDLIRKYQDTVLHENNDLLKNFAKNLKAHILAVMLSGDKISYKDISNAKVILYYINRQLNDTFGLNEPLNAANQFLAEPDLVKKYQLDEFLEEHKND